MRRTRWKLWRTPAKMELYQINKYSFLIWAFVTHSNQKAKAHWLQGFINKKFTLDIIPPPLLHTLPLSSPSIPLPLLPLVSPDSVLCLPSAQVSNTPSEQWLIVFYWAALVFLPLPFFLPSLYLPCPFSRPLTLFLFIVFPVLGGLLVEMKKLEGGSKKEWAWVKDAGFFYETVKEKGGKFDKLTKEDRGWEEHETMEMKNCTLAVGEWRSGGKVRADTPSGTRQRRMFREGRMVLWIMTAQS